MTFRPLLLALLPLVSGCAADRTGYPSLAKRPIEGVSFDEPAAPAPAAVTADPALDASISRAVSARRAAASAFDQAAGRAEALARAAAGAAIGSDRWLDAQTALAELDTLRAGHADAVGELEELAAARAQALEPAYPALELALEEARAAGAEQTGRIDRIAATVPGA